MFGPIISIKADIRRATRDLTALERRQIPFASATAVNSLAALVQNAEKQEIRGTFESPTPFTVNSVRVKRARKSNPTAIVYIGQIAEAYLAPFISGGRHSLGSKRALLNPKGVNLNRYGNIPKKKLAALKADPTVFIGSVTFKKSGETVSGVWRRPDRGKQTAGAKRSRYKTGKKGTVGGTERIKGSGKQRVGLQLLIRFGEALEVTEKLPWFETATGIVQRNAMAEMDIAMKAALGTARP